MLSDIIFWSMMALLFISYIVFRPRYSRIERINGVMYEVLYVGGMFTGDWPVWKIKLPD